MKEEGFILAHSCKRAESMMAGKAGMQEAGAADPVALRKHARIGDGARP